MFTVYINEIEVCKLDSLLDNPITKSRPGCTLRKVDYKDFLIRYWEPITKLIYSLIHNPNKKPNDKAYATCIVYYKSGSFELTIRERKDNVQNNHI